MRAVFLTVIERIVKEDSDYLEKNIALKAEEDFLGKAGWPTITDPRDGLFGQHGVLTCLSSNTFHQTQALSSLQQSSLSPPSQFTHFFACVFPCLHLGLSSLIHLNRGERKGVSG